MPLLQEHTELEFDMVYYVKTGVFEKINIVHCESKEVIGQADFSVVAAPKATEPTQPAARKAGAAPLRGAGGSPPSRANVRGGAAAAGNAAARNNKSVNFNAAARRKPAPVNKVIPKSRPVGGAAGATAGAKPKAPMPGGMASKAAAA